MNLPTVTVEPAAAQPKGEHRGTWHAPGAQGVRIARDRRRVPDR